MSDEAPPPSGGPWTSARLEETLRALEGLLVASEPRHQRAYALRWLQDDHAHLDVARARRVLLTVVDAMVHRDPAAMEKVRRLWPRLSPESLDATETSLPALDLPGEAVEVSVIEATPQSTAQGTVVLTPIQPEDVPDTEPDAGPPPPRAPRGTWLSSRPREPSAEPAPPPMDLDQYAVLCAWTEARPDRRQALHDKFGVADEAARTRLDAAFEERFREDASLRLAFASRMRMHLSWIRQS